MVSASRIPISVPVRKQLAGNFPDAHQIPAGHWFMMGDNRGESDDSRFWGPVPTGWIIGEAHRHLLASRPYRQSLEPATDSKQGLGRDAPRAGGQLERPTLVRL